MTISRVLVAPLNYSHRQTGQVDAFEHVFGAGNVRELDFMAIHRRGDNPNFALYNLAMDLKPDWIWLQVQGSDIIQAPTLERIRADLPGCFITHWMGDLRPRVHDELAAICRATHATLISSTGQIPLYARAGARRVHYVQIGLDPEDYDPTLSWDPPFRVPDIAFCGGYYGHVHDFAAGTAQRLEAIRHLARIGFDVGVVGPGWPADIPVVGCCHVKNQVHIYRRAKIVLSINHFNSVARYYSDRHLIAMASGTPVVAKYIPELENEFEHGVHCLMWHELTDLEMQVRRLMQDIPLRNSIGAHGYAQVIAHHTWRRRIHDLVPFISQWRQEDLGR